MGLQKPSYPSGDQTIQGLLKAVNQFKLPIKAQYLIFLGTMFQVVYDTVRQNISSSEYHDQALQWHDYLQDENRKRLYDQITQKTITKLQVSI